MAKYKIIPSSKTIVQSPISIGHKAEKGVEAIEFDLTAWVETYGSGTLTVIMRRWGDAIPYPIALEIDENNKATWTLSDIDTAKAGMAYAQLNYIVGDEVVKKSDIYTFRVMDSLTGEGEPPEAYESWLEHLTHFAAEAMAEVLDIEGIVTDKTLTVDGGIADAKATGEALAEKVDAADYSELSDRVGRNTIALAEKADRSTTYTKTEVDALIDDVEVETDTTLAVSGAPADAKKVGDELSDIKADLGAQTPQINLLNAIQKAKGFGDGITPKDSNIYLTDNSGTVGVILRDGFDTRNIDFFYHPEFPNGAIVDGKGNVLGVLSKPDNLNGKKFSILGDSISTYDGYLPSGYATYYPRGDIDDVSKTWWKRLEKKSGMELLKNASWSGSRVSGDTSLTTGQTGCSDARINALKDGDIKPDIIICYISTNDWAHDVSVGTYDSTEDVDLTTQVITNISDAYAVMLYKIRNAYPDAHVYCVTSLEGRRTSGDTQYPILNANNESIHQTNHAIAEIAHIFGAKVIDLQTCGIHYWNVSSYTVDGTLHPNSSGAELIADVVYKFLKEDI